MLQDDIDEVFRTMPALEHKLIEMRRMVRMIKESPEEYPEWRLQCMVDMIYQQAAQFFDEMREIRKTCRK